MPELVMQGKMAEPISMQLKQVVPEPAVLTTRELGLGIKTAHQVAVEQGEPLLGTVA